MNGVAALEQEKGDAVVGAAQAVVELEGAEPGTRFTNDAGEVRVVIDRVVP